MNGETPGRVSAEPRCCPIAGVEMEMVEKRTERSTTMAQSLEDSLLAEVRRRTAEVSAAQHDLARQQRLLTRAATQLRLGRSAALVMAEIREQSPELLLDWCDVHLTMTPAPLRTVPRTVISA
jgi:hypothetical protein